MKHLRKVLSLTLALLFMLSLAVTAFAETYVIDDGSITVTTESSDSTVKTKVKQEGKHETPVEDNTPIVIKGNGTETSNTITISPAAGTTASVTLQNVEINTGFSGGAAVTTSGSGNVILELDGTNTVTSGFQRAGVEKTGSGSLTITDANNNGSLTANGGDFGAGIGGGDGGDGTKITISGGTVNATGGNSGAGIGGGDCGNASDITISGGTVNANGGYFAAGIGGGQGGDASVITITSGTVNATGGLMAAGIGGGYSRSVSGITISGDAEVHVAGGASDGYYGSGAAIGYESDLSGNNGVKVDPDTSELYTTGSITTYPAGTSIEQMKNGTVQGTTISGIIDPPPQPEPAPADAAADPFLGFCLAVAEKIKAAPENGTLEINAGRYTGFASFVLEALAQRPDLTLSVTWKQGGADQTLTIPAGKDLTSLSGNTILFTDIAGIVG